MAGESAKIELLYVEDNPSDVTMVKEILSQLEPRIFVSVATDGSVALEHLGKSTLPAVILLDLNLPLMDGLEVLQEIKTQPRWKAIPVLIFSSSRLESDLRRSRELNADDYYVKPSDLQELENVLGTIVTKWVPL